MRKNQQLGGKHWAGKDGTTLILNVPQAPNPVPRYARQARHVGGATHGPAPPHPGLLPA